MLIQKFISLIITTFFFVITTSAFSDLKFENPCQKQIKIIENQLNIPVGLLTAIGKTESGRISENKNIIIWPWTVNINKKSLFFDTRSQMEKFINNEIQRKNFNLDVGCMQINLKWHKNKFKNILNIVDPMVNVSYATSFLYELEKKHGSWDKAIKYYHSSKPEKNTKYYAKVLSFWKSINDKPKRNLILASTNKLEKHIKEFQPNLYNELNKIMYFRKIFMEKSKN